MARRQLSRAFDGRDELMRELPAPETAFAQRLVDGFLPASKRSGGVNNEAAAVDPSAIYHLEATRSPVLVVHAGGDRLNPVAISREIAYRIEDSRLIIFSQGGHLLLGHHTELRELVSDFLAGAESTL